MKRLQSAMASTFIASLCAATLTPLPASAAAIAGIATSASAAKRTARIPVLAPTALPNDIIGGGVIWAALANATASGYDITISPRKRCRSAGCRFGFIRGSRPSRAALAGRPVHFASTDGYYTPANCATVCTAATLAWSTPKGRYVLGLRGAGLSSLESTARTIKQF